MKLFHHHEGGCNGRLQREALHQRVWQDVLKFPATIDENGSIQFGQTNLGELRIHLSETSPEGMALSCLIFEDLTDKAPASEDILRICNRVNRLEDAKLVAYLDSGSTVYASIYLILNAHSWMPDEGLLREVIGPAMARIKDAKDEFARWLGLEDVNGQKSVNDHLLSLYRPGMSADALFESYKSSPAFGEDRCIVSTATGSSSPPISMPGNDATRCALRAVTPVWPNKDLRTI